MVNIPAPPSANAMYRILRNGKRVKTSRYLKWRNSAGYIMRASLPSQSRKTPLEVTIRAAVSRRRDIDNVCKPTLDALQCCGVIPDDRWVDKLTVERAPGGGETIEVSVERRED